MPQSPIGVANSQASCGNGQPGHAAEEGMAAELVQVFESPLGVIFVYLGILYRTIVTAVEKQQ
jgi:hypothetical protein